MLLIMRPMKESTISSAEMSISTPLAPVARDALGQVVLQRHREPVVHVHLDRHQQELAHPEDRNAFHRRHPESPSPTRGQRVARCARSASRKASASVALVSTSSRSTPRWTMVWRDLRPDAADDAVGAHQARRRHGLDQVLRHQRVDGRHAGDVDDGDRPRRSRRSSAAGSPSPPGCARCRACRSGAAPGCRPTA